MASKLPADDDRTVMPANVEGPASAIESIDPAPRGGPLAIGARLRHFEVTGHLGEGGFGIVYLAHDLRLDRKVAIKEYMPSSLAWRTSEAQISVRSERDRDTFDVGLSSFRNEARLLAHFDHPSLVKVYDYWDDNGTAYMAMPFYQGTTLKQFLADQGAPAGEEWLKQLLQSIAGALGAMHSENCLHRDISPDNILLRDNGVPLLLDFGAARRVISDRTHNLTVILKPGYAPVEQYAETSSHQQGPWTDIYALAAVSYLAITGKVPVQSVSRMMRDDLPPLATLAADDIARHFCAGSTRHWRFGPRIAPKASRRLLPRSDWGTKRRSRPPSIRNGIPRPRSSPLKPAPSTCALRPRHQRGNRPQDRESGCSAARSSAWPRWLRRSRAGSRCRRRTMRLARWHARQRQFQRRRRRSKALVRCPLPYPKTCR